MKLSVSPSKKGAVKHRVVKAHIRIINPNRSLKE